MNNDELKRTMRATYNEASSGDGLPTDMILPCETCGEPVLFHREKDTTVSVHHDGCEQAHVTMETLNPRKLGVITGITE